MNEIFVTNGNDFDHQDRYNGEDFFFPKGERVTVPIIAAAHMFGLGNADKTETLVRLGWANDNEGVKKLASFVFTQGVMVEAPLDDKQALLPLSGDERPAA